MRTSDIVEQIVKHITEAKKPCNTCEWFGSMKEFAIENPKNSSYFRNSSLSTEVAKTIDIREAKKLLAKRLEEEAEKCGLIFCKQYYCFDIDHIISPHKFIKPDKVTQCFIQATFKVKEKQDGSKDNKQKRG